MLSCCAIWLYLLRFCLRAGKYPTCLFHPSVRVAAHQKFADEVEKELDWCRTNANSEFKAELQLQYEGLTPSKSEKQPFEIIFSKAVDLLTEKNHKSSCYEWKDRY